MEYVQNFGGEIASKVTIWEIKESKILKWILGNQDVKRGKGKGKVVSVIFLTQHHAMKA